jgi:hypothetical protein
MLADQRTQLKAFTVHLHVHRSPFGGAVRTGLEVSGFFFSKPGQTRVRFTFLRRRTPNAKRF